MKSYAQVHIFTPRDECLLALATAAVAHIPEPQSAGEMHRCHEVARAVAEFLQWRLGRDIPEGFGVVDGHYASVEHSWIVYKALGPTGVSRSILRREARILDVYAVGSLPMVRLVDADASTLRSATELYRRGLFSRDDIRHYDVSRMVAHLKESPVAQIDVGDGMKER